MSSLACLRRKCFDYSHFFAGCCCLDCALSAGIGASQIFRGCFAFASYSINGEHSNSSSMAWPHISWPTYPYYSGQTCQHWEQVWILIWLFISLIAKFLMLGLKDLGMSLWNYQCTRSFWWSRCLVLCGFCCGLIFLACGFCGTEH